MKYLQKKTQLERDLTEVTQASDNWDQTKFIRADFMKEEVK